VNRFAALIDRLATAADDAMKQRLLADYLAKVPEPDRIPVQDILAAKLKLKRITPALVRGLAETRIDPKLYQLSLAYVGDVAETIALLWPPARRANRDPSLSEVIEGLSNLGLSELPRRIEQWLDACDVSGRWALIKLVTGTFKSPLLPFTSSRTGATAQDEMFSSRQETAGTITAVLLYAERGRAKSAPTICTMGLWRDGELLPVGKAPLAAGADRDRLDAFVRENTVNRFGPVREVARTSDTGLVLEIAFDALKRMPRRKSGIELQGARIERICWDEPPRAAATLDTLVRLLPVH
jgi:ATP-dependent DNA ligase